MSPWQGLGLRSELEMTWLVPLVFPGLRNSRGHSDSDWGSGSGSVVETRERSWTVLIARAERTFSEGNGML